jgi:glycine cleavage system transcriptional repressor
MNWSVLTLVGADRPGIVARVSQALFDAGCELAEASMMRLGGNFAIMLRVAHPPQANLRGILAPVVRELDLHLHIDEDVAAEAHHFEPDVQVTVYGADRAGIVAQVTSALAAAGLNIIDLETAVGGTADKPIYIMSIEGNASASMEKLQQAIKGLAADVKVTLTAINTMVG